jgi:hypothetical protein
MHYWDQVISCREEGQGKWQGTDVWVCVPSQETYEYGLEQSALHKASKNGLAGTVATLLAHGANAVLADKVRACIYVRTHDDTHKQSILLGDLPCGAFHLYAALYCCGVFAAQIYTCKHMHI